MSSLCKILANRAWESACDIAFRSDNSGNEFAVDEIRDVVMQKTSTLELYEDYQKWVDEVYVFYGYLC